MEEKLRFIFDYEQSERSMTDLCQSYGIARETGYVWVRRYRSAGLEGLVERSRAAKRHPIEQSKHRQECQAGVPMPHEFGHSRFNLPPAGSLLRMTDRLQRIA